MKRNILWAGAIILAAVGATVNLLPAQALTPAPTARQERKIIVMRGEGSWLGVQVQDVTAEKVKELKLPGEYGALVTSVEAESPASRAGLKTGDVILDFAGQRVRSVAELERMVRETPPSRAVDLKISRDGKNLALTAQIAKRPEGEFPPRIEVPPVHIPNFDFNFAWPGRARLGILGNDLTPQLAQYFGVKQGKGVLVSEVDAGGAAQKAGLKAGDVIVRVGDTEVDSVAALRRALSSDMNPKRQLTLTVVRDRQEQEVTVELPSLESPLGPERVAELRNLGINPAELERLKAETQAHAAELAKSAREFAQVEAKQDVQAALQAHKKQMQRLKQELLKLRRQLAEQTL
jgi:serine protease Do